MLSKNGVCPESLFNSGLSSNKAKEMTVLKEENESLRKLIVEKELENQALREFIKKNES
jgi:hypothetical protein